MQVAQSPVAVATIPAFTGARKIASTLNRACKASIKADQTVAVILNQFIDACRISGIERSAKGAEAVRKAVIAGSQDYIEMGGPVAKTFQNYATGVKRAFFHGVEWTPRTFQDPALAVPSTTTGKTRAGSVTKTNNAALVRTLAKALQQTRLMENDVLAGGILDLILEIDPVFTETIAE